MVNEETPEERLKKYKENLAEMAQSDGLDSKISNSEEQIEGIETPSVKVESESSKPRPPQVLESPAKRELRESDVVKKRREALYAKLESKSGKSRILLRAREKAIMNQLQEIKSRKSTLELQYKRKVIDRDEYDRRMQLLVSEGHELLKEKTNIDKTLAH